MNDLEQKIEEAAARKYEKTRGSFSSGSKFLEKVFIEGATSPESKAYWQQGMYAEEKVKVLLDSYFWWQFENEISNDGSKEWFEQNKK